MAAKQKDRLGRGLASLLGDLDTEANVAESGDQHRFVATDLLSPCPLNPRRDFAETELNELAASIKEKGLVQPLLVRERKGHKGEFEIVAGERRWRAAQRAGVHQLPVIVRALSDQEALELTIIENVQRTDLNAIEEALGYRQLIDSFKHTQDALAEAIGKSRSHLANMLRLLKLPDRVQVLVREGRLSSGHARALVGHRDAEALAEEIIRRGLTVRDVEALVQGRGPAKAKARKAAVKDADTLAAERSLSDALGLGVSINRGKREEGELRIRYRTLDQLDDVMKRLLKS